MLDTKRSIVKNALWVLSNIAAMYRAINSFQRQGDSMNEDECLLQDGTIDQVLDVINTA